MRPVIALCLAIATLPAFGQTMYRCGAAYSDKPCGANAQVTGEPPPPRPAAKAAFKMPLDVPVSPDTEAAVKTACTQRVLSDITFKDPDSVKVTGAERRGFYYIGDVNNVTRIYVVTVNAKNSYGGYVGPQGFICHVDPVNERKVLLVEKGAR